MRDLDPRDESSWRPALVERLEQICAVQDGWWGPGSIGLPREVQEEARVVVPRFVRHVPITLNGDGALCVEMEEAYLRGEYERHQERPGDLTYCAKIEPPVDGAEGLQMFLLSWDPEGPVQQFPAYEFEGAYDRETFLRFVNTGSVEVAKEP